jgi:hypothetical protein
MVFPDYQGLVNTEAVAQHSKLGETLPLRRRILSVCADSEL